MKQIVQNLKSGKVEVDEVPSPVLHERRILVRTGASLISAGTERMIMKLARKSLAGKARERPDLVRKVLAKIRRDGVWAAWQTVRDRLDQEVPLGYSLCGEVVAVGPALRGFEVGRRVACAGAGFANHAELNCIPPLLAVPVPDSVGTEAAAYATVGAIALQGIRNADVRVGESVVVLGLGLIGQLAVQILKQAGCRVVGLDVRPERADLAARHGAELALTMNDDAERAVLRFTRGRGADAVVITAATSSNRPVELAARLARDRARVIMVGVTGMDIPRKPYFEKELTFLVSRSYGPGRYDPQYEIEGHDYPAGYVRWTENRNIEAFLDLVAAGGVCPDACTTHRFPIDEAEKAFELVFTGREPHLGVVLTYPQPEESRSPLGPRRIELAPRHLATPHDTVGVSLVGAGRFARSVLLPQLARLPGVAFRGVVTASGISARSVGRKYGFAFCTSEEQEILEDDATVAVVLATPHSRHADGVCRALRAGKAVFVEKPLAITGDQLQQIRETLRTHPGPLMVGFNRRFSALADALKQFLAGRGPLCILYRCNAGPAPNDHWISDPNEGGRILGEACHFFDFFAYLTDAAPLTVFAVAPSGSSGDDAQIVVTYADGSVCHLAYTSAGPDSFGKERVEAFAGGRVGVLEDFRHLHLQDRTGRPQRRKLMRADKGHARELAAFVAALREGRDMPIAVDSLIQTTRVSLAAVESMRRGEPVPIAC